MVPQLWRSSSPSRTWITFEATYAQKIKAGEEIIAGNNQHFRVIDVMPFEEEDEPPFVGC